MPDADHAAATADSGAPQGFLWLELTNRCNLQCTHCYAESGPDTGSRDRLGRADYERLIGEGFALGYREIQFIGGEPTLNADLLHFIRRASDTGYTYIEVFTNLMRLTPAMLEHFRRYRVRVATSVYAADEQTHDAVTRVRGSFKRTTRNLQRLVDAGIAVRAGTIEMPQNAGRSGETIRFLNGRGVAQVGSDRLRHFGRGAADGGECLGELCGNCAGRTLCVAPDGRVSPCIMSKAWSVGSVLERPLAELAASPQMQSLRAAIHATVVAPRMAEAQAGEAPADAYVHPARRADCDPSCNPWCHPGQQCFPCNPNGGNPCEPNGRFCGPR